MTILNVKIGGKKGSITLPVILLISGIIMEMAIAGLLVSRSFTDLVFNEKVSNESYMVALTAAEDGVQKVIKYCPLEEVLISDICNGPDGNGRYTLTIGNREATVYIVDETFGGPTSYTGNKIIIGENTIQGRTKRIQIDLAIDKNGQIKTRAAKECVKGAGDAAGSQRCNFSGAADEAPPSISSVDGGPLGQGAAQSTLTVNGSYFEPDSVVSFSGAGIVIHDTRFINQGKLKVDVSIDSNAASGTRDVQVTTSHPNPSNLCSCFTISRAQQSTVGGINNSGYLMGSITPDKAVEGIAAPTITDPSGGWYTDDTSGDSNLVRVSNLTSANSATITYKGFNFNIPASNANGVPDINGICVMLNDTMTSTSGWGRWETRLSWNNGSNFTSFNTHMADISATNFGTDHYFWGTLSGEQSSTAPTSCSTWGRTWTLSDLSSANFQAIVKTTMSDIGTVTTKLDVVGVKVLYTPQ